MWHEALNYYQSQKRQHNYQLQPLRQSLARKYLRKNFQLFNRQGDY
jgi:hypothetical protein